MEGLHGNESKINACQIKEHPVLWANINSDPKTRKDIENTLHWIESVLLTRLSDESVRDIINFAKATMPVTPIDETEKALVSQ